MPEQYRIAVLEDDTTLADDGTKNVDIDLRDPISELEVHFSAQNYSDGNQANHPHDCMSKVELVDGSEVLWSLSFIKGQAVNFWEIGKMPVFNVTEWASDGARDSVHLRFGRGPEDRELAFLADRFLNPQLKLTWDLATVRAVGSTGFTTGSGGLTVIARTNPHAVNAKGFLMTKDVHSWTTVASGDESVDLPRDYPYRLMVVRSYEAGNDFRENLSNLKLTCDQDKDIIFDIHPDRLSELMHIQYGPAYEHGKIYRANSDTVYCHVWEPFEVSIQNRDDYVDFHMSHYWSANFILRSWNHNTGAFESGDKRGWYTVTGQYPHCTVGYPFGDQKVIEEWFDPKPYGAIKLKCTQADAGAAASVILQQYRPY